MLKPIPAALITLTTLLAGCASLSVEPAPPLETAAPVEWSDWLAASGLQADGLAPPFWKQLEDPILDALIEKALAANPDLAVTASRLREARALARADIAALGPRLGAGGSLTAQRLSETGTLPAGRIPGIDTEQVLYDVGFDASWELGLFGRHAARRDIAEARVNAAQAGLEDARASLIAEISRDYVALRGAQAERKSLALIIDRQRQLFETVEVRRDFGEASDLDLERARIQLASFEARQPPLEADIRTRFYRLSVLTGSTPSALSTRLSHEAALPLPSQPPGYDLTSDVLRQRADVRQAERNYFVAARNRDLTALDIYPTVSLFAGGGPNTTDLVELFDPASLALDLGALFDWVLIDGGRREALTEASDEQRVQAAFAYRRVVLRALEEVEVAAARLVEARRELQQREVVVAGRADIADMARMRFEAGTGTLMDVLETERDLAEAEIAVTRLRTQSLIEQISLEKALGLVVMHDAGA